MTISIDEFVETFRDVQVDMKRDYQYEDGTVPSACDIMHRDIQLGQTPAENRDELAERYKDMTGEDVNEDILDFTEEHQLLHALLQQFRMEAILSGCGNDAMLALMFSVGRRYGMREAAKMFSPIPDAPEEAK